MPGPHGYARFDRRDFAISFEPMRRIRQEKHISQRALANKIHVSVMTILRIEKGRHDPTLTIAYAISRALGVNIAALTRFTEIER